MSKFQRSLELFKRSVQIMRENRKLFLFPILISIFVCLIELFFLVPIVMTNTGHPLTDSMHWNALADQWGSWDMNHRHWRLAPAKYWILAVIYLISMFLSTFFNVAFFNEIFNALNGRPVSILGGLRFAVSRLKPILAWSLFAGLVGLIIKGLEERSGLIGRWIVKLIGLAWSVSSIFAIPVIVREEKHTNPLLFLKSSASLLKRTWGEALIGFTGIAFGGGLVVVATLAMVVLCAWLSVALNAFWITGVIFFAWFAPLFVFCYVLNIANMVYRAALFIYATEGVVPGPFNKDQMDMAWKIKSGRNAR